MKTEPVSTLEHKETEKPARQKHIEDVHDLRKLVTLFPIASVPYFLPKKWSHQISPKTMKAMWSDGL